MNNEISLINQTIDSIHTEFVDRYIKTFNLETPEYTKFFSKRYKLSNWNYILKYFSAFAYIDNLFLKFLLYFKEEDRNRYSKHNQEALVFCENVDLTIHSQITDNNNPLVTKTTKIGKQSIEYNTQSLEEYIIKYLLNESVYPYKIFLSNIELKKNNKEYSNTFAFIMQKYENTGKKYLSFIIFEPMGSNNIFHSSINLFFENIKTNLNNKTADTDINIHFITKEIGSQPNSKSCYCTMFTYLWLYAVNEFYRNNDQLIYSQCMFEQIKLLADKLEEKALQPNNNFEDFKKYLTIFSLEIIAKVENSLESLLENNSFSYIDFQSIDYSFDAAINESKKFIKIESLNQYKNLITKDTKEAQDKLKNWEELQQIVSSFTTEILKAWENHSNRNEPLEIDIKELLKQFKTLIKGNEKFNQEEYNFYFNLIKNFIKQVTEKLKKGESIDLRTHNDFDIFSMLSLNKMQIKIQLKQTLIPTEYKYKILFIIKQNIWKQINDDINCKKNDECVNDNLVNSNILLKDDKCLKNSNCFLTEHLCVRKIDTKCAKEPVETNDKNFLKRLETNESLKDCKGLCLNKEESEYKFFCEYFLFNYQSRSRIIFLEDDENIEIIEDILSQTDIKEKILFWNMDDEKNTIKIYGNEDFSTNKLFISISKGDFILIQKLSNLQILNSRLDTLVQDTKLMVPYELKYNQETTISLQSKQDLDILLSNKFLNKIFLQSYSDLKNIKSKITFIQFDKKVYKKVKPSIIFIGFNDPNLDAKYINKIDIETSDSNIKMHLESPDTKNHFSNCLVDEPKNVFEYINELKYHNSVKDSIDIKTLIDFYKCNTIKEIAQQNWDIKVVFSLTIANQQSPLSEEQIFDNLFQLCSLCENIKRNKLNYQDIKNFYEKIKRKLSDEYQILLSKIITRTVKNETLLKKLLKETYIKNSE